MEVLIFIVGVGVGIIFGWRARERYAEYIVKQLLEQHAENEKEAEVDQEEVRTKMRLEVHSDVIYAYDVDDNSFIAQGVDLYDLDSAIQARFPGKKFSIREDNLKEIGLKYNDSI